MGVCVGVCVRVGLARAVAAAEEFLAQLTQRAGAYVRVCVCGVLESEHHDTSDSRNRGWRFSGGYLEDYSVAVGKGDNERNRGKIEYG